MGFYELVLQVKFGRTRLKIAGATWHPDTINPMLALRIIRANNWWSEFWNRYKHPEYINILNSQLEPKLNLAN
ncbi:MAG: hypothetical protein QNJ54_14600 [Prochloraceae cyanobacterium]|nr:hypothetical protein [Prochloraceae cyanobacterium]